MHKYHSLIGTLRRAPRAMRMVAGIVIIAFTGLLLSPTVLAAKAAIEQQKQASAAEQKDETKLAKKLQKVEDKLARISERLEKQLDASVEISDVKKLNQEIRKLEKIVLKNFDKLEAQLQKKKLPTVIMDRHTNAVTVYKQEMATLLSNLQAMEDAPDADTLRKAGKKAARHIKAHSSKRKHQHFDPNNLPNRSLQPNPDNKPKKTKDDFHQAGLFDNPFPQLAAHGSFTFDMVPGANDPAYLAQTTEVTFSQAVQDKATELEHDPVKIYHWVRNNIEWQPSWGAVQNADLTLSARRGNAMDIASLLIALLRTSGIPARYVHGTIEVPTTEFKNWAGGFTDAIAAADYAASAGIPIANVAEGGQIAKHQLEHIWVEAAIDYQPSRGAENQAADQWVAMDASYKQYEELQGLDAIAISGLDPEALAQSFIDSGTVNETEGWVSGFDPTILETAQNDVQAALEQYITDNIPNPTVGDVIGGRRTIIEEFPVLPSNLPNRILVEGTRYGTLPANLQQTITFTFDQSVAGDPPLTLPWASVNNEKLTLSFRPATQADEDVLVALLPEGQITDISQLPDSIPAYLIEVIPELKHNGVVIKNGSAMNLGEDFTYHFNPRFVGQGTIPQQYTLPAGSYVSVAAIAGNVSPRALTNIQTVVEQTDSILESGDETQIATLGREAIPGDLFYAGTLGYYAQYTALSQITGLQRNAHHYLAAGLGSFGYEPNVDTFFGLPRAITLGGVTLNIPIINVAGASISDTEQKRNFVLQIGAISSSLEYAVPEQMFTSEQNPGEAISAVKALSKANAAGQRIYHLTPANQTNALQNIHHDSSTMAEIQSALAVGKEVVTHTDPVSVPGYTGAGYIIIDPITGSGAYKIGGGINGGVLVFLGFLLLAAIIALPAIAAVSTVVFAFTASLKAVAVVLSLWSSLALYNAASELKGALKGFMLGASKFQLTIARILSPTVNFIYKMLNTVFN